LGTFLAFYTATSTIEQRFITLLFNKPAQIRKRLYLRIGNQ
jgi:hypothetical protein